jgi:hypothetical protein
MADTIEPLGRPLTDDEALAVAAIAEDIAAKLRDLTLPAMCELVARVLGEARLWANLGGFDRAEVIEALLARLARLEQAERQVGAAMLGTSPTPEQLDHAQRAAEVMRRRGATPNDIPAD